MKLSISILFALSQALLIAGSPASSAAAGSNPLDKRDGTCSFLTERVGYNEVNMRCWRACDDGVATWCWSYDKSDLANERYAQANPQAFGSAGGCEKFTECFPDDKQANTEMLKCGC